MKFELRRITFNKRLSEETNAYAADLYADGKLLAHVSNSGQGGPDMQNYAKGRSYADIEAAEAFCKSLPHKDTGMVLDGKPFIMEQSLESVCGDLLAEHLLARDLARLLKRTIAFVKDGKVLSYKGKYEGVARAHLVTDTLREHPGAVILNNLPPAEALALYRASTP